MRPQSNRSKPLVALIVVLALVAAACGGGADQQTQIVNRDGVATSGWGSPAEPEPEPSTTPTTEAKDPGRSFGSPNEGDEGTDISPSVLAYAIENSTGLSYSFEQGISMNMALDGYFMNIDPDAPLATGEVEGTDSHVAIDIGPFLEETFSAIGLDDNNPGIAQVMGAFADAEFDIWTEGNVITLDMSDYVAAAELMAPGSMSGLPGLDSGPVSIDLSGLENLDPWILGGALGNTQVIDPSALVQSLREVNSISEIGTDSVAGRAVTVYSGSLTMADYYAAIGQDLETQMAELEGLLPEVLALGGSDPASMAELMADIDVSVTAMVDEQSMLRRIEFVLDMSEIMGALTGGSASMRMTVGVWQEFDQYGQSFNIEAPDALDITASFHSLFGDIVAA